MDNTFLLKAISYWQDAQELLKQVSEKNKNNKIIETFQILHMNIAGAKSMYEQSKAVYFFTRSLADSIKLKNNFSPLVKSQLYYNLGAFFKSINLSISSNDAEYFKRKTNEQVEFRMDDYDGCYGVALGFFNMAFNISQSIFGSVNPEHSIMIEHNAARFDTFRVICKKIEKDAIQDLLDDVKKTIVVWMQPSFDFIKTLPGIMREKSNITSSYLSNELKNIMQEGTVLTDILNDKIIAEAYYNAADFLRMMIPPNVDKLALGSFLQVMITYMRESVGLIEKNDNVESQVKGNYYNSYGCLLSLAIKYYLDNKLLLNNELLKEVQENINLAKSYFVKSIGHANDENFGYCDYAILLILISEYDLAAKKLLQGLSQDNNGLIYFTRIDVELLFDATLKEQLLAKELLVFSLPNKAFAYYLLIMHSSEMNIEIQPILDNFSIYCEGVVDDHQELANMLFALSLEQVAEMSSQNVASFSPKIS